MEGGPGGWYLPLALGMCLGPFITLSLMSSLTKSPSMGAEDSREEGSFEENPGPGDRNVISMSCTGFQPSGLLDNLQKFPLSQLVFREEKC